MVGWRSILKFVTLITLCLVIPFITNAGTFEYHFALKPEGYELTLKMTFPPGTTLSQVRNNFRNQFLFKEFNPNITDIELSSYSAKDYQTTMSTQSLGITSTLISDCHETESANALWNRHCELQTQVGDGGKYMHTKNDTTFCQVNPKSNELTCRMDITGRAKPITLIGFTLVSEQKFTLKAKESALRHFVPLWIYGHQGSVSTLKAKELFEEVGFRQSIEEAFKRLNHQSDDLVVSTTGTFELPTN